jgi:prepilin-type N-terminal cleavage/methylation domain-containing protein
MMRKNCTVGPTPTNGFSLIELMIVMVIVLIIAGAIFKAIDLTMQRSAAEQNKLDMTQEGREFMDQMSRDLRQAGYPNPRNFTPEMLTVTPTANDSHVAVGLVKVAANELWFEGDVDGTGTVSVVHYWLDPSTSNNCPCLKRSQLPKVNGDPLTGQTTPSYQVEVQGVTNSDIFSAKFNGAPVTLPVDFASSTIGDIDTVQATVSLQSSVIDAKTRKRAVTSQVITVRLNNCSLSTGSSQSCS